MINLFILFCSMCLQFGAIDVPTMILPNFMPSDALSMGFDYMRNSGGIWSYYSDVGLSEDGIFITSYDYGNYFQIKYYVPVNPYVSTVNSNFSLTNYSILNDTFISGSLTLNGYSCYVYYYYKGNTVSNFGAQEWYNYDNQSVQFYYPVGYAWAVLAYTTSPLYYNNELVIVPKDYVIVPEYEGLGSLGSMSSTGHSSDGNPLESLNNFSWSGHSSSYIHTGHNTHVLPSSATPDFTNAEQNLLGQIVDNTNSIIENTNNLGGALEVINGNIINGASAIFNAISQFNNNFVSTFIYDQEQVDATLENSSMFLFASTTTELTETIINESDVLLDTVHDMEEKQDLILYLDLTKWKVPVYSSSTGVNTSYVRPYNEVVEIDFTFLKETKSIWQPILLGVLYLALFMSIYFDLPNILRGANA